jgi:hypothetical protein
VQATLGACAVISALRRRALRGRRNGADRGNPSMQLSLYRLLHPSHQAGEQLMLPGGWRQSTGRVHHCKAIQRRHGKTGRRVDLTNYNSTIL